jgi:hypothetical protein
VLVLEVVLEFQGGVECLLAVRAVAGGGGGGVIDGGGRPGGVGGGVVSVSVSEGECVCAWRAHGLLLAPGASQFHRQYTHAHARARTRTHTRRATWLRAEGLLLRAVSRGNPPLALSTPRPHPC